MKCRAEYNCVDDTYIDVYSIKAKGVYRGSKILLFTIHVDDLNDTTDSKVTNILEDGEVPEFDFITNVQEVKWNTP